uniref:Galectin n=1 Tax=Calidris pygmaea TaxID=425635 RepID=A0A8C3JND8_9CHAR
METGGETKTLFSSLSTTFKPMHSPCRNPVFQCDKKPTAVSSVYRHLTCSPCPFTFLEVPVICLFSFSVTLLCDPVDASKDVGLLFTVNFSDKSITRNARIAGKWGREEKTIPYFPFTAGDTFKMELLCEHQQIRVLLDGRQLCDFTHRIQPLNLVKALQITGDIKLTKVA